MIPLLLAAVMGAVGFAIGRNSKSSAVTSGAETYLPMRRRISLVVTLQKLVAQRLPVSPGLAQAAYREAMQSGDTTTAQQIAIVFFPPQWNPQQPPPPIVIGEEETQALQETYADAEPVKATSQTIMHNAPPPPTVQDVSPEEWKEFLLCFKTREPSYRGERHVGAFEQSARRLSQLGIDAASLTTEDAQYQALDKDLNNYLQSSEQLLNDFTGETVQVNGQKVAVTRSGVLALLKAAGPAGAKGWLTEEHQRKAFPHTTEIFTRGNGRF